MNPIEVYKNENMGEKFQIMWVRRFDKQLTRKSGGKGDYRDVPLSI